MAYIEIIAKRKNGTYAHAEQVFCHKADLNSRIQAIRQMHPDTHVSSQTITCEGCIAGALDQRSHMGEGGCLDLG